MVWRTIRRNSKRVSSIFAQASKCEHYSWTSFAGIDCDPDEALKALRRFPSARLKTSGPGQFRVSISANNWYDLTSSPPAGEQKEEEV